MINLSQLRIGLAAGVLAAALTSVVLVALLRRQRRR